jgi:hypothetical protein
MANIMKVDGNEMLVFEVQMEPNDDDNLNHHVNNEEKSKLKTKAKKVETEDEEEEDEEEEEKPKPKAKAKAKAKAKKVETEDEEEDEEEEEKPKPKAKAKAKAKAKKVETEDEEEEEKPKPKAKAKAKAKKVETEDEEEEEKPKPKAKAKAKAKAKKVETEDEEEGEEKPKTKTNDNVDKLQKECINDLKKIYTIMKHINSICLSTYAFKDRLTTFNKMDLIKISKEERVTFINEIGNVLYKLFTLNDNEEIDTNFDLMDFKNEKIINFVIILLQYVGKYVYNNELDTVKFIEKHIDDNIKNRNAKIYSIHTTLYMSDANLNLFNGIIVILNDIIEKNQLNNDNKNKTIKCQMFMQSIKEKVLNNIKYSNMGAYDDDEYIQYYINFKNVLMDNVLFEKILLTLVK